MSLTKKSLMVGGVAMATLGLSTCKDGGAVDPAPPPLDCTTVGKGESLSATGSLAGQTLKVTINNSAEGTFKGTPQVTSVTGGKLANVTVDPGSFNVVTVEITLDPGVTSGSFTFNGTLQSYGEGPDCAVAHTFNFAIADGGITVAMRDRALPLGARDRAAIVVTRREGRDVELHAMGASAGAAIGWTATAGAVDTRSADRVTWRLPEEPGLYQIELLVDRGREGLSIDTLTLEVG